MSTTYNRKVRRGMRPQKITPKPAQLAGTTRHRPAIRGVQQRAFRKPVRSCAPPKQQPKPDGVDLMGKLVARYFRLHTTPPWAKRIAELWKERRARTVA